MTRRIPVLSILLVALMVALLLPAPANAQLDTESDVLYEVVSDIANEPMSMEIAPDGRIIWGQRDGVIWVMDTDGTQTLAGRIETSGNASTAPDASSLTQPPNRLGLGGLEEGGLQGILLHRDFANNNTIFVYRSMPNTRRQVGDRFEGDFALSSFVLDPLTNQIDLLSEEELLRVPAEWDWCCHYSGDLDYLPDGTILLTTGDDAEAEASGGYGPRDHRKFSANAERTSANPADLRGKILRLREDGTVPDGSIEGEMPNPFIDMEGWNPYLADGAHNGADYPDDYDPDGDGWIPFNPYVYSIGYKQPWRAVVHPVSGTMYVSDVGPDSGEGYAGEADGYPTNDYDPDRGPAGYEEINAVPMGGGTHAGWPRCVGDNFYYMDVNWATGESSGPLDCSADVPVARPIGSDDESEWITGMTGASIYYSNAPSDEWPVLGSGGKTSEPVAFYPAGHEGALALPDRYENRLFSLEWTRKYILTVGADPVTGELNLDNDDMWIVNPTASPGMDADRPYGASSLIPLQAPIDGKVNPIDGAFYFIEYGSTFYFGATGRLSRLRGTGTPVEGANYGLPVASGDELIVMDAGLSSVLPLPARTIIIAGLGMALVGVVSRRRSSLV